MKKHVAILTGGRSSEREVALSSAKVIEDLVGSRHDVTVFDFPSELGSFLNASAEIDVAIPVFHGKGGEDGAVQGLLSTLGIPFLFSGVSAHAIGLDKVQTKRIIANCGIATPGFSVIKRHEPVSYTHPCVIKPIDGGSSIGISIARSEADFTEGINDAFRYSDDLLVEDYVAGDEYTVAVIEENGLPVALPVIQIRSKKSFFDYESKYSPDLVEEICPAPIGQPLSDELQKLALSVHGIIGARHISRSDFIVDSHGKIWFLEINTIPGQTLQSLVPKAIRASGRDFAVLLDKWILEMCPETRTGDS